MRGGGDIASWPLLTKAEVRAAPKVFARRLAALHDQGEHRRHVGRAAGPRALAALGCVRAGVHRSHDAKGRCRRALREVRVLRTESIKDPNDFKPPYWIHAGGGNRLVLSSTHLNAATIEHYARAIDEFAPECLLGYPTSLEALCFLLKRAKRQSAHSRRAVFVRSAASPSLARGSTAPSVAGLLDYYGQAERVAFAYATAQSEYRFLPGYAHVEFEPAGAEGEYRLYEIVGTPLWNRFDGVDSLSHR